ncbi:DUF4116 domain-containing protein [Legionella sp. PATHC035]|uniref:DUF4116 domain-containing protein n=1 Tax=Legionella sp. PATHC035 TaxID=2992040 RepID=UPI0022435408|nr:DUF4116 domain-containing protein [Legionella sp. PATHC035]MCW8407496.1 DUF4116 domain-containing protein [Legionella sp. PATHC035]
MLDEFQKSELEKVRQKVEYLADASEDLKAHEEFMLEAIKISSFAMYYANPQLKDKEGFVLAAIAIDCDSYVHISDRLKDSERVASVAIRKKPSLYFYSSERLRADEDYKNNTLKINSWYPWIKLNKVLKNNFWEGLKDTFSIMYGDYGILKKIDGGELDPNQLKYGLIDITLIPQLSNFLINYGMPSRPKNDNPFKYVRDEERWNDKVILRNISCCIGFGLQFLRLTMAAAATLIVFPIVALVHILKFPLAYYYQHQLLQLEGVIYNTTTQKPISDVPTTLAEFAAITDSSLSDLCGYESSDITSYSSENSAVSYYGSLRSTNPNFFFRPSISNTPAQIKAQQLVAALEINEKYDPNDSRSDAIGRSFW